MREIKKKKKKQKPEGVVEVVVVIVREISRAEQLVQLQNFSGKD